MTEPASQTAEDCGPLDDSRNPNHNRAGGLRLPEVKQQPAVGRFDSRHIEATRHHLLTAYGAILMVLEEVPANREIAEHIKSALTLLPQETKP